MNEKTCEKCGAKEEEILLEVVKDGVTLSNAYLCEECFEHFLKIESEWEKLEEKKKDFYGF